MKKKILIALVSFVLLTSVFLVAGLNPVKADSVTILSSSSYVDSAGFLHVVGEVQNSGSNTISFVEISATFYDSNGKVVDTGLAFASLSYMQPNTKSPFDVLDAHSTLVPQIATYKVQVSYTTGGSIQQGLVINSDSSYTDSIGFYHIVGEIQNTGSATSSDTAVYATCYDSSGKVVDTGLGFANPDSIESGNASPFDILITDSSQTSLIASYALTAQSSDYALVSSSPTPTPTATPTVTTQSTPLSTTPVPEFPAIAIIGVFLTVLLFCALMLTVRKRKITKN